MKHKIVFISEAIRRDSHAPLRFFDRFEVLHFYLRAPYSDMTESDFRGSRQVKLENLLDEIIRAKPDVIQGAEPFGSRLAYRLSQITLKAAQKTGAKLVVPIFENRPISQRFNLAQRAALWFLCPKLFRRADAVVVLNYGAQQNVLGYYKNAKVETGIIWGVWGVDLDLFKPVGPKKRGQIVFVGRLVEDKGLKYLVEGFIKASKKISYISLCLVGQGDYEREIRAMVKTAGVANRVEFAGVVPNVEVPKYLSQAELSVYPSITQKRWEEQVGTVNFQAMACGAVALTTKSGAIPEYIKDGQGAILVPERDANAIARAIEKFYSDAGYRKKLQAATRLTAKEYDIKEEIEKAQKLVLRLLDEKE